MLKKIQPFFQSRALLTLLNIAVAHSLSSTKKNTFQTITNLNATANPCQTFFQPNSAPNIGP